MHQTQLLLDWDQHLEECPCQPAQWQLMQGDCLHAMHRPHLIVAREEESLHITAVRQNLLCKMSDICKLLVLELELPSEEVLFSLKLNQSLSCLRLYVSQKTSGHKYIQYDLT